MPLQVHLEISDELRQTEIVLLYYTLDLKTGAHQIDQLQRSSHEIDPWKTAGYRIAVNLLFGRYSAMT